MIRILILAAVLSSMPADASPSCGAERQAVKVGVDAGSAAVDDQPADTSVQRLIALPRPRSVPPDTRAPGSAELRVWRVAATITAYKLEADGDVHVVLSDGTRTMIAEFPAANCAAASRWRSQIDAARAAINRRLRPSVSVKHAHLRVTVTGVGFFDVLHGQLGVAPNGIELHPVLGVAL